MFRFTFFVCLLVCASETSVWSQSMGDLSFISGKWKATTDWGNMEEHWSKPLGNSMMCSYHCVKNGQVVFYEFIVIEKLDSTIVMKLRHFSPGSIAWEDKNTPYEYPLVLLEGAKAKFESRDKTTALTFIRISPEKLYIILERKDKDGKPVIDTFNYTLDQE